MNRSTKGFGLTGVLIAVLILTVSALFTTSAKAKSYSETAINTSPSSVSSQGQRIIPACSFRD